MFKTIIKNVFYSIAAFSLLAMPAYAKVTLKNPLKKEFENPAQAIGVVIKAVMGIVGSIALAMFIYGGLLWLTSGGNPDRIKKGKDILMWAIIGLVVIFVSYNLVSLIITTVAK